MALDPKDVAIFQEELTLERARLQQARESLDCANTVIESQRQEIAGFERANQQAREELAALKAAVRELFAADDDADDEQRERFYDAQATLHSLVSTQPDGVK